MKAGENVMTDAALDLAEHFMECGRLGRYLTTPNEARFVVTDDFRTIQSVRPTAAAMASICSKDALVAQAALLPLGLRAAKGNTRVQARYEELFTIIEEQTLNPEIKYTAGSILNARFTEAKIKEISGQLADKLTPARKRYRSFLEIVSKLTAGKVTAATFRDEFLDFTYSVAGKLDFGIYSFCIDRIFQHSLIPVKTKALVVVEILGFPPMIRRELLSNILSTPGLTPELSQFVQQQMSEQLPPETSMEITLLLSIKTAQISVAQLKTMTVGTA